VAAPFFLSFSSWLTWKVYSSSSIGCKQLLDVAWLTWCRVTLCDKIAFSSLFSVNLLVNQVWWAFNTEISLSTWPLHHKFEGKICCKVIQTDNSRRQSCSSNCLQGNSEITFEIYAYSHIHLFYEDYIKTPLMNAKGDIHEMRFFLYSSCIFTLK